MQEMGYVQVVRYVLEESKVLYLRGPKLCHLHGIGKGSEGGLEGGLEGHRHGIGRGWGARRNTLSWREATGGREGPTYHLPPDPRL